MDKALGYRIEDQVKHGNNKRQVYLICALLILATLVVYWKVVGFDFTNFDDAYYVKNNPFITEGLTVPGIQWSLTTTYQFTWVPLVWMSYMADHDLSSLIMGSYVGGADPRVCHVTNLLLHIANVVLLFLVLASMTGRPWLSAFVAALFAVHPLHVESVAWIAERKDVLSTLFWLLTMLAYVRYVRKPGIWRYALVVLAYCMGLMSKPMLVTLPIALLVFDYWPLDRLGTGEHRISFVQALREKIPLLALALASTVITLKVSNVLVTSFGSSVRTVVYPLGERVANAFVSYVQYILMMFWPRNLAAFYPHPTNSLPAWQVLGSVLVFASLSVLALRAARTRPYVTAGWLWYVITLLPVIGFVQVGMAGLADRFTYVPLIGPFIVVAWGAPDLLRRLGGLLFGRILAAGLAVGLIAILMVCSHDQVDYWRDSYTLFSHAIRVTGPNAQAHASLGWTLQDMGKTQQAIDQFRESLRISPERPDVLYSLGRVLAERGSPPDLDEAIKLFYAALKTNPRSELLHNYLGAALMRTGRLDAAISHFREALRLYPDLAEAQRNLDDALAVKASKR
jgi:hypothetical protein